MAIFKSISEMSPDFLRDTWYNGYIIYRDFNEFFRNSMTAVLDDNGFELDSKKLVPFQKNKLVLLIEN
jgi:hypothetical protein